MHVSHYKQNNDRGRLSLFKAHIRHLQCNFDYLVINKLLSRGSGTLMFHFYKCNVYLHMFCIYNFRWLTIFHELQVIGIRFKDLWSWWFCT